MKRVGTAAIALALATACGSAAGDATASPSVAISRAPAVERLVVSGDAATAVVDASTGRVVASLPGGALSPSLDLVWHLTSAAQKTVLAGYDLTGAQTRGLALDGEYAYPNVYGAAPSGFSPNGKWLVLVARDEKESRFAVIDVARGALARTVTLSSRFTFDAIHNDGTAMYLIEHPDRSSTSYNVRLYDLRAGVLQPGIIFDKSAVGQLDPTVGLMDGTFHVSVAPKIGDWSYGLYMRPNGAPFVHALNVPGQYAQCIVNLAGQWSPTSMFSMALSDDARALYVIDPAGGSVSVIDGASHEVARRATFTPRVTAGDPRAAAAVVAHDGSRLYATGASGIAMLQTKDLMLGGWLASDLSFRSLAISSDNARLYGLAGDSVVTIDIATGRIVATAATVTGARAVLALPATDVSRR